MVDQSPSPVPRGSDILTKEQPGFFPPEEIERQAPEKRFNLDRAIDDLVGSLSDPIIVYPSPWKETLPEEILKQVPLDRMVLQMRYHKGDIKEMTATDTEALLYMYPASLEFPLDHDWAQIYIYLGSLVCGSMGREIPEDLNNTELTSYQMQKLEHLKRWIYDKRVQARKARRRGERINEKSQEQEETGPPVVQHTFDLGLEA